MRNIEKVIIGTIATAVVTGLFRNDIKYAEEVSNMSMIISVLTLSYNVGREFARDYFGRKEEPKKSARIIEINPNYNQEAESK